MDRVSEFRLLLICPAVADKVRQLAALLGFEVRVVQGLRSWNEQQKLFEEGRSLVDGKWVVSEPSKVVTKCKPGNSWHNFGLAVDVAPDDPLLPGYQPDWHAEHPTWKKMEETARSLGFVCGADFRTFPDNPHLQITGRFPVNPTDEVRQLFKDGGMKAVWMEAGLA